MPKEPQVPKPIEMTDHVVVRMEQQAPAAVHGVNDLSRPPALPRRNSRYEECNIYESAVESIPNNRICLYPVDSLKQMQVHMERPTAPPPYSH